MSAWLAWLVLATTAPAATLSLIEGDARDPASGALLYREQHLLQRDGERPLQRLVLYRCADGRAFARKTVHYDGPPQAPQFELDDARFGYREGYRDGRGFARRQAGARERDAAIDADDALVVDAGFDEYVRARWPRLVAGETLRLDFLVPSRLSRYGFKLRHVRDETVFGEPARVFRLGLSGLLGWLAEPIEVSYRERDRRLLRFEGMSNIRRDPDDNFVARIEFPPAREQPADPARWQAALAEPLVDCRAGD